MNTLYYPCSPIISNSSEQLNKGREKVYIWCWPKSFCYIFSIHRGNNGDSCTTNTDSGGHRKSYIHLFVYFDLEITGFRYKILSPITACNSSNCIIRCRWEMSFYENKSDSVSAERCVGDFTHCKLTCVS